MVISECRDDCIVHSISGAKQQIPLVFIKLVNRARLGAGKLYGLCNNGIEYGLEIERRVDRLADVTKRAEFVDRAAKLAGALAQLGQEPHVFNRYYRLS